MESYDFVPSLFYFRDKENKVSSSKIRKENKYGANYSVFI